RNQECCTCRRARLSSKSARAGCKEDAQQELGGMSVARLRQMFAETKAVSVVYTNSRPRLFSLRVISDSNEASPHTAEQNRASAERANLRYQAALSGR